MTVTFRPAHCKIHACRIFQWPSTGGGHAHSGTAGPLLELPPLTVVSGPDQRGPQLFSQYPQPRWANPLHRKTQHRCPQPVGTLPPRNGRHPRAFCTRGRSWAHHGSSAQTIATSKCLGSERQTRRTESPTQGARPIGTFNWRPGSGPRI